MIYRGPGSLSPSSPTRGPSLHTSHVSMLDRRHTGRGREKERQLGDGRGEGGGGGAKSYDGDKACSSIYHSMLSGVQYFTYVPICSTYPASRM